MNLGRWTGSGIFRARLFSEVSLGLGVAGFATWHPIGALVPGLFFLSWGVSGLSLCAFMVEMASQQEPEYL